MSDDLFESPILKRLRVWRERREQLAAVQAMASHAANMRPYAAGITGKLDVLIDRMETATAVSRDARDAARDARSAASNVKWNILATALAVIAVLIALVQVWGQAIQMTQQALAPNPPVAVSAPQSPQGTAPGKPQ